MSGHVPAIAVCVSGRGTNLRALLDAERRGLLGGRIALVVADRPCPALQIAEDGGVATGLVSMARHSDRIAWDAALAAALTAAESRLIVLAGFMRLLGARTLEAFPRRILNVHPSLLPAFPGAHAVADTLAAGARVSGVTVHIVDASLDGGPIVAQEAIPILPGDDEASLTARLHAVEHRLLPRCVQLVLGGAARVAHRGVTIDLDAAAALPGPRRALLSVSDKRDIVTLGRGLVELGFELVSTGGTSGTLRRAGLAVTDVADLTGAAEMLDGRVKTLHPRIAAGLLADLRNADHRRQLAGAWTAPIELAVVNLYPFAEAARRPGIAVDELIEEVDIGGPTLVRAAAKNHETVTVVTDPDQYPSLLAELRAAGAVSAGTRRRLAAEAFRSIARYDATVAHVLGARLAAEPPRAGDEPDALDRFPSHVSVRLRRTRSLRYGENPHQRAALYGFEGEGWPPAPDGPFAGGAEPLQGKDLSYNNILDAAAAAGVVRDLRDPACAVVKHANPCGAAEADDVIAAWEAALAGDPASAFGGVVAVSRPVDRILAERLTERFLEVVLAPGFDTEALEVFRARTNLRLVPDSTLGVPPRAGIELRSAGGGLLATDADVGHDNPTAWRSVTERLPTAAERRDLDLAWRLCRHVRSNAIVLVRDRALVGLGAGQPSRLDSARLAAAKAGPERARGAVCASDAFFPFADGAEALLAAGVTAFVQPGGSQRDAGVIAAVNAAGAAMLFTGTRHFRH